MSDAPTRVRASRPKSGATKRVNDADTEAFLLAEIDAILERSGKRLEKLNADMDALISRMDRPRLKT